MKTSSLLLWLFLLVLCSVQACQAQEEVHLYDKKVSATLPKGLLGLTPAAIAKEYPGPNPPQYVYKTPKGDYSVVFNHLSKVLPPKDVLSFHAQLKQQLETKMPSLQWLSNPTLILQNRTWGQLEFKTVHQGEISHTWILITSWHGRALEVVISAFEDVGGEVDIQVKNLIESLQVAD